VLQVKKAQARLLVIVALAGLVLAAGTLRSQEPAQGAKEDFSANLMTWSTGGAPGQSTRLNMTVERWATQEEVAGWKKLLAEKGPDALYNVLSHMNMGKIQTTQSYEYAIYVAVSVPTEKGRVVKLLTERPVFTREVAKDRYTLDYIYSAITLTLDEKGKGAGTLLPTAKVFFDKNGKFDIDTNMQPQKLMNARKV
jgi:hypothetical protein